MPASRAASAGVSSEAHFGRGMAGVLSPQPTPAGGAVPSLCAPAKPYLLPKYTRAADSTP